MTDYSEWNEIQLNDRVKKSGYDDGVRGTVLSVRGIGKAVKWDNGIIERVTDGSLRKIKQKKAEMI